MVNEFNKTVFTHRSISGVMYEMYNQYIWFIFERLSKMSYKLMFMLYFCVSKIEVYMKHYFTRCLYITLYEYIHCTTFIIAAGNNNALISYKIVSNYLNYI